MRALLLVVALLAGCASAPAPTPASTAQPVAHEGPAFGVAFTPAGNDVAGFFQEAPQLGSVVLWGGPAEQLGQQSFDANGSTAAAVASAKRYHPAVSPRGIRTPTPR
ncbi:MAG: hypothetical protein QOE90_119 [Thermoplasmata archaeon]|jgi:hypothetical protein|nr:hypothetical protein [Thermoplasmata archaeon]